MGLFLHEHQQPAIQDERTALLVGQRRSFVPDRAAVVTHQDAEMPVACVRRSRPPPLRRGDDQPAIRQAGQVGVVKEEAGVIRHLRGDHVLLCQRLDVGVAAAPAFARRWHPRLLGPLCLLAAFAAPRYPARDERQPTEHPVPDDRPDAGARAGSRQSLPDPSLRSPGRARGALPAGIHAQRGLLAGAGQPDDRAAPALPRRAGGHPLRGRRPVQSPHGTSALGAAAAGGRLPHRLLRQVARGAQQRPAPIRLGGGWRLCEPLFKERQRAAGAAAKDAGSFSLRKTDDHPPGYAQTLLYGVTDAPPEQRGVGVTTALARDFLRDAIAGDSIRGAAS